MPDLFADLLGEISVPKDDPKGVAGVPGDPPGPQGHEDPPGPPGEPGIMPPEPEALENNEGDDDLPPEEPKTNPVEAALAPKPEKVESKEDKASKAFAEMRSKNAKYEKALQRAAEVAGKSVDQFLEDLDERVVQKKAKDANVDPEFIKRVEALEADRLELQTSKVRHHIESQFNSLKSTLKLNDQDLMDFTTQLYSENFDFNDLNVDYLTLYRGKNYEKLLEKERQSWIARSDKGQSAASVMSKNGKNSGNDKPITTMSDLEDLLSSMGKE